MGNSEIKTPKATLLTWTQLPLETVYSVWWASKDDKTLLTPEQVRDTVDPAEVRKLFRDVIAQRIPIGEHLDFVFMLENISISWREQAVRHRIGTRASPERLGADYVIDVIPDLADSSWWSQSGRIRDAGKFYDNREYRVPETVLEHQDPNIQAIYETTMYQIQLAYNALVEAGIPMEDARELMPLGMQHRMSWRLNIGSLQHIFAKRGCQILQLGIWGPIIEGMVQELADKVDPIFSELVSPPCVKGDRFTGCVYKEENRRRYTGDDKLPPCSLQFEQEKTEWDSEECVGIAPDDRVEYQQKMYEAMHARSEKYRAFWRRNPWNGTRLNVL